MAKKLVVKKEETVEIALERAICEIAVVPYKKEKKAVPIEMESPVPGNPPIKSTAMRLCLPSPAHEIFSATELYLNIMQDKGYRTGYMKGYDDKSNDLKPQLNAKRPVNAPVTSDMQIAETEALQVMYALDIPQKFQEPITEVAKEAFRLKRNQGYANGYWQGFQDSSKGITPQFQTPSSVPKTY